MTKAPTYRESLDQTRKKTIEEALKRHNGNRTKAALELGIDRQHLYRLVKRYKIGES